MAPKFAGKCVIAVNGPICLENQRRIDELEEELKNLKANLSYRERHVQEGFLGRLRVQAADQS